jgi:hypothetical protein
MERNCLTHWPGDKAVPVSSGSDDDEVHDADGTMSSASDDEDR